MLLSTRALHNLDVLESPEDTQEKNNCTDDHSNSQGIMKKLTGWVLRLSTKIWLRQRDLLREKVLGMKEVLSTKHQVIYFV